MNALKLPSSLMAFAMLSLTASAQTGLKPKSNTEARSATPAATTRDFDAYYYTPMGMTFAGADKDEKFDGDYAFAPVGTWLETKAEVTGGTAEWSYPTGVDSNGKEIIGTSTAESFRFRMKEKGIFSAPALTVSSGLNTYTYTAATAGIRYGEIGYDNHFAVNYQPAQTTEFSIAPEILTVNDNNAKSQLNLIMAMSGSVFSDINILGFAESFYDCGPFYLQSVSAEIYSDSPVTADDIAVKVFKREKQSVSAEEIAALKVTDIYAGTDNRYYVTFSCDEPAYITTAMQVVILPAEGKSTQFSPVMPLQSSYHSSNAGTASFYADFTFAGKKAKKQYIDFYGTEVTDEYDKTVGFLNHWAIGIKGSYDKPDSGIETVEADQILPTDSSVYSISGIKVGEKETIDRLPAGLYICEGKKIIIK